MQRAIAALMPHIKRCERASRGLVTVATSRVVLGLHYPSDVLAATATGVAIASLSLWLVPGATLFGAISN